MISSALTQHVLRWVLRAVGLANKALYRGTEYQCPICGSHLRAFLPLPAVFRIELEVEGKRYTARDFETLAVDRYQCPVCRAADRDRLVALFLAAQSGEEGGGGTLLHFAPEPALSRLLRRSARYRYRTADLLMRGVDERIDVTRMEGRADASVDAFICSHVLEHVPDDRRAMAELFRVLRPGGWGVVMTPILAGLPRTSEDPSVTEPAERLRRFGQGDHVRVYAKADFVRRLEEAGFEVEQLGIAAFGADAFRRAGIDEGSCLYVVRRGAARTRGAR